MQAYKLEITLSQSTAISISVGCVADLDCRLSLVHNVAASTDIHTYPNAGLTAAIGTDIHSKLDSVADAIAIIYAKPPTHPGLSWR
jgi:hypothetical protein